MSFPMLTPADTALIVAGAGKVFIEIADSMPPPEPGAGYFTRWVYGFMQRLASNSTKAASMQNLPLETQKGPQ
jgi:hypothetical protein